MTTLFLPGSSGRGSFWDPVRALLPAVAGEALDWPGLDGIAPAPDVAGFGDLVTYVARRLGDGGALVGQSMGAYVAVRVAIEHPDLVDRLVLCATSAGIDTVALGATDWRPGVRESRPDDPSWLFAPQPDLTELLRAVRQPTLLLWADDDELSPVAVGRRLTDLIPDSELVVYESSSHWFVHDHALDVAARIERHLLV